MMRWNGRSTLCGSAWNIARRATHHSSTFHIPKLSYSPHHPFYRVQMSFFFSLTSFFVRSYILHNTQSISALQNQHTARYNLLTNRVKFGLIVKSCSIVRPRKFLENNEHFCCKLVEIYDRTVISFFYVCVMMEKRISKCIQLNQWRLSDSYNRNVVKTSE